MTWRERRKEKKEQKRLAKETRKNEAITNQQVNEQPKVIKVIELKDEGLEVVSKDLKKEKPAKYHVSQNKNARNVNFKKWRVRKEGSQKTIKYFDTQKAAIDYATILAEKFGTSIVIHKLDGAIRKQDYKNRA